MKLTCIGGPMDGREIEHDVNTGDQLRVAVKGGFTTYNVRMARFHGFFDQEEVFYLQHHEFTDNVLSHLLKWYAISTPKPEPR